MRVIYWRLAISGALLAAIALGACSARGHGLAHDPALQSPKIH